MEGSRRVWSRDPIHQRDFLYNAYDSNDEMWGRKHSQGSHQLREIRREMQVSKRRNLQCFREYGVEMFRPNEPWRRRSTGYYEPEPDEEDDIFLDFSNIDDIIIGAQSQNPHQQLIALQALKELLSNDENDFYYIDKLVKNFRMMETLAQCLKCEYLPKLQYEALWILTEIASAGNSEQRRAVVHPGFASALIKLIRQPPPQLVLHQAVWVALSTIICDGPDAPKLRKYCIDRGVVESLVNIINSNISADFLRNLTMVMSVLCQRPPELTPETIMQLLPALYKLIKHQDTIVLEDTAKVLFCITDGGTDIFWKLQSVMRSGVVPDLVDLLSHQVRNVATLALRTVRNIALQGTRQNVEYVAKYINKVRHTLSEEVKIKIAECGIMIEPHDPYHND